MPGLEALHREIDAICARFMLQPIFIQKHCPYAYGVVYGLWFYQDYRLYLRYIGEAEDLHVALRRHRSQDKSFNCIHHLVIENHVRAERFLIARYNPPDNEKSRTGPSDVYLCKIGLLADVRGVKVIPKGYEHARQ